MSTLALWIPSEMPCDEAGQEYYLRSTDANVWIFGRASDCDLVFEDRNARTVSRRHCAVQFSDLLGRWEIVDLDSTCGTWLNGFKIPPRDPTPLDLQDRFSLGTLPHEFVVLECPGDTISGEEDEGAETIASTDPLTIPPEAPHVQPPQQSHSYGDTLYTVATWLISGETLLGKIERFCVAVALVAVVVVVVAWVM